MKLGMIKSCIDAEDFDYIKSKGLEFAEYCMNYDKDEDFIYNQVETIKSNMARTGITAGCVGRWNVHPFKDGKIDQAVMDRQYRLIDFAHEIGSPVFVTGCAYDDSVTYYKNVTLAIEYFKALCEYTKKYDMKCGVVNCDWNNWVHSPEHWELILPEVPELMIKFDSSHAINRKEDYLQIVRRYGEKFCHMHIKGTVNHNGNHFDDPPAGMDMTNWPVLFAILYNIGYNGTLSIEPHSSTWRGELAEPGLDFTINYIRPFIVR